MLLIRAIIRPEKTSKVMKALFESGYAAVSKLSVVGRGKQRGIKIGDIIYDELDQKSFDSCRHHFDDRRRTRSRQG